MQKLKVVLCTSRYYISYFTVERKEESHTSLESSNPEISIDENEKESFDLTQLPVETTLERMSRIEEKAMKITLDDDVIPLQYPLYSQFTFDIN